MPFLGSAGSTSLLSKVNRAASWNTTAGSLLTSNDRTTISNINLSSTHPDGLAVSYSLVSGSLPTGLSLSSAGVISGSIGTLTTAQTFNFTIRSTSTNSPPSDRAFSISCTMRPDGSDVNHPGTSASSIKTLTGTNTDGIYYINLPTVGSTAIYCIMDNNWDGGGWMMAMKAAATGTTFNYDANYWTTANTLNTGSNDLSAADSKFDTMNYFSAKDIMARWPDIGTSGGGIAGRGVWTWLENDFFAGTRTTLINFFNSQDRYFKRDAKTFTGWQNGVFSSQVDIRFYGFNYRNNNNAAKVRWGFGWNENGEGLYSSAATLASGGAPGSDDVSGGIGLTYGVNWSAGDRIACCQDTTGINRQARVEVYVR